MGSKNYIPSQSLKKFLTTEKSFLYSQIFIWLVAFGLFGSILFFGIWSDLHLHIEAVRAFLKGEEGLPTHFLYFLLVAILGLGQANMYILSPVAGILLATAVWAKYVGTYEMLQSYSKKIFTKYDIYLIAALVLLFAMNIPGLEKQMGGQIPPNVWHNSTTIFLMPFVLALFWYSWQFLEKGELKLLYPIGLFLILNVLIKPSFFLCFAPVFPLFALGRLNFTRKFWLSLVPILVTGLLVVGEYVLLYMLVDNTTPTEKSGIEIAPFRDWAFKSNNIGVSLLVSIAYPLVYGLLYFTNVKRELLLQYGWGLFLVAMLILICVVETGPRATHGNFRWQAVVCNYLLFLGTTMSWLKEIGKRDFGRGLKRFHIKDWILLLILALHLCSGLVYLVRIFVEKTTLL